MTFSSERFRHALGIALAAVAAVGVAADLLGYETIPPAYYAAMFAVGYGIVPDPQALCHLPSRVLATLRPER